MNPAGYHLVNVLLHCTATGLFSVLAGSLFGAGRRLPTAVASLLFASHPIHTEVKNYIKLKTISSSTKFKFSILLLMKIVQAVAGIVGRADVGAAIFFLLALLSYRRYTLLRSKASQLAKFKVIYGANNNGAGRHHVTLVTVRKWAWLGTTLLMAACAMLTKEHGVTVLAVCAVYDLLVHSKVKVRDVIATLWQVTSVTIGRERKMSDPYSN